MRYRNFWPASIFILLFFAACEDYEDHQSRRSGGNIDEVMIIVSDGNYRAPFSDTLADLFMPLFPGLPQPEPLWDIRIRSYAQFEYSELLQKYRNLIFAAPLDNNTPIANLIKKRLGPELIERAHSDPSFFYAIQRDAYAEPQLVVYIFAPTEKELFDRIRQYRDVLFNEISKTEQNRLSGAVYFSGINKKAQDMIEQKFDIQLKIPGEYLIIEEDSNFMWISKQETFYNKENTVVKEKKKNILIHQFPLNEIELQDPIGGRFDTLGLSGLPFRLRDTIANKHIFGRTKEYTMYTDIKRPLFQDSMQINNNPVLVSRGLWRMDNPFQGGPFLNYMLIDTARNKVVLIDGYIYAAGSKKRREVRELETIFSSLNWIRP